MVAMKRRHLPRGARREKHTVAMARPTWTYVRQCGRRWGYTHGDGKVNLSAANEQIVQEHMKQNGKETHAGNLSD